MSLLRAPRIASAQDSLSNRRRLAKPKVDGGLSLFTNNL